MFCPVVLRCSGIIHSSVRNYSKLHEAGLWKVAKNRGFTSWRSASTKNSQERRLVHMESQFEAVPPQERDKTAFMAAIAIYKDRKARNHVEFINSALKFMKPYGVHKDIEVYKALLNIFPKGKMIPQNQFQKIFLHFPMQQNCCVKLLDEMEWHGVQPDKEIHDIVMNAFGEWNFATKKIKRMLYWMPKLKHSNKYLDRRKVEGKKLTPEEVAGLVLQMIARDPGTFLSLVKFDDNQSANKGWIASAQSPLQQRIVNQLPKDQQIFIDGPYPVYLMDRKVDYVVMTCEPTANVVVDFKSEENKDDFSNWFEEWDTERRLKTGTIHEQPHETILALGVLHRNDNKTGSLWFEHLQKTNPHLRELQPRIRLDKPVAK